MKKCSKCAGLALTSLIAVHAGFPCVDEHTQYCELHEGNPDAFERLFSGFESFTGQSVTVTGASASVSASISPSPSPSPEYLE